MGAERSFTLFFFTLSLFFYAIQVSAGPDPCSATILSTDMVIAENHTTSGYGDSGVEVPPYGNYYFNDAWFEFTMPSGGDLFIFLNSIGISNPAVAIYEDTGDCTAPKLLYNVVDNNCDFSEDPQLHITDLISGGTYYIRIWSEDGVPGDFDITLTESSNPITDFITHGDAMQVGDCIYLTEDVNTQNGCAWYTVPIDFSQPFRHEMYMNFGDNNSGADGIALVYQPDPDQPCGFVGGGIGVDGMPNSAIFEFDTWFNGVGQYNDPPEDHANFFVDGDILHGGPNDINGPALLPNIEDGVDHLVVFEWLPPDMYTLTFDGSVILQGNYDIVNNVFGGSTTAYWGFTSATGAANNDHIVCPLHAYPELGTQSYEEATVCYGETYNGYSAGFYTELSPNGNCSHQHNIQVFELPEVGSFEIDTLMCQGSTLDIEGYLFNGPGSQDIVLKTDEGCDSIVVVNVEEFEGEVLPHSIGELDCSGDPIKLYLEFITNYNLDPSEYIIFWEDPNDGITYDADTLSVTQGGNYTGYVIVDYGALVGCQFFFDISIDDSPSPPSYTDPADLTLSCGESEDIYLNVDYDSDNFDISWSLDGDPFGSTDSVLVNGPGTYTYTIFNTDTGCSITDEIVINADDELPQISMDGGSLDCDVESIDLNPSVEGTIVSYEWNLNGDFYSSSLDPGEITESGTYTLTVEADNGCINTQSVTISIDTLAPVLGLVDYIIPCDTDSIDIVNDFDDSFTITWTGPSFVSMDESITVSNPGIYYASLTNPANGCETLDSLFVTSLGNSPSLDLNTSVLTCTDEEVEVSVDSDVPNVSYDWTFGGNPAGDSSIIEASAEGDYIVTVTTETGCISSDTITVTSDYTTPTITTSVIPLDCENESVKINTESTDVDVFEWIGPNGFTSDLAEPSVSEPGMYNVIVTNAVSGCSTTESIEIIADPSLAIFTLNPDVISCTNDVINIDFSISSDYESVTWTGPLSFSSNEISPEITVPGTYNLHIEVAGDCDIDTMVTIIGDLDPPSFFASYQAINCEFPETVIAINTDESNTILLTDPNGNTFTEDMVTVGEAEAGEYTILITAPNGCSLEESFTVLSDFDTPPLELSGGELIDCNNPSSEIALSTEEDVTINWTGPEGYTNTMNRINVTTPGTYIASIIDVNGCTNIDSIVVGQDVEAPILSLSADGHLDCIVESVNIVTSTSGSGNIFEWTGPDFISSEQNITIENGGTYSLTITGTNGCVSTGSIDIDENVNIIEVEAFGNDIDCDITEAELTFETNSNYDVQGWVGPNNTTSNNATWNVNNEGMYIVTLVDEYGCEGTDTIYVDVNNNPPVVELLTPALVELKGNEQDDIEISVNSDNGYTIQWLPEVGLSCYDCLKPSIIGDDESIEYTVTITSENGCFDDLTLTVRRLRDVIISVPNIISKRSNSNTHVTLYGNENVKGILEFYIYDRWGNLVFRTENIPHNEPEYGWDGYFNGEQVTNGVYTYMIIVETFSGERKTVVGDVTVFD